VTTKQKAAAWQRAANILRLNAAFTKERDPIAEHISTVIAESLDRRADIIKRNAPRRR
jgi:hypothetical protein